MSDSYHKTVERPSLDSVAFMQLLICTLIDHNDRLLSERMERLATSPPPNRIIRNCGCLVPIAFFIGALLLSGCTHQRATISTDARKVIRPDNIITIDEMPEKEAIEVYEATGIYRGLDDDAWIFLIQELQNMHQIKREQGNE